MQDLKDLLDSMGVRMSLPGIGGGLSETGCDSASCENGTR